MTYTLSPNWLKGDGKNINMWWKTDLKVYSECPQSISGEGTTTIEITLIPEPELCQILIMERTRSLHRTWKKDIEVLSDGRNYFPVSVVVVVSVNTPWSLGKRKYLHPGYMVYHW